ncbi:hypothetical protein N878_07575 [Pseudomonas sp. EGD-AK9]|uniref:hypothetical protein n=1 Tax=Pseudomonas sp. EGD-AK9 TaxID=1386078 RepID=UPI000396C890|nr:hypothetical protein [Pseudomonas sp. EGD-AK9]ERI50884.1 hypothetical protein N878_07575 [Pseudomonas sp. EGD-AK9]
MQAQNPEVSGDKATTPAADLRLVSVEQLRKIHRELDACQKVIWLAGCRPRVPNGFDPAYVTGAQEQLQVIEGLIKKQPSAAEAIEPCGECIEGLQMIDPYDGGTFITCKRCSGRGFVAVCPTCRQGVPADSAHLLSEAIEVPRWTHEKPAAPGAYWVRGFRLGEPDSRPALVEVSRNEGGELLCNIHERNSNDETHQWSFVADCAERFEWFGPLQAGNPLQTEPYAWFWSHGSDSGVLSTRQDYEQHKSDYPGMTFTAVYALEVPHA